MSHLYRGDSDVTVCYLLPLTVSFPPFILLGNKINTEILPSAKETGTGTRKYLEARKKQSCVFLVGFFLRAVTCTCR